MSYILVGSELETLEMVADLAGDDAPTALVMMALSSLYGALNCPVPEGGHVLKTIGHDLLSGLTDDGPIYLAVCRVYRSPFVSATRNGTFRFINDLRFRGTRWRLFDSLIRRFSWEEGGRENAQTSVSPPARLAPGQIGKSEEDLFCVPTL